MSETKSSVKYEPHVLVDVVDPTKDGTSPTWKKCCYSMLFIEFMHFFTFVWFAWHSLTYTEITSEVKIDDIPNLICVYDGYGVGAVWGNIIFAFLVVMSFIAVAAIWYTFAYDQQKLDYTINHTRFRIRNKKGLEGFSKYGVNNQSKSVFEFALNFVLRKFNFFVDPRVVITAFTGIEKMNRETGMTIEKLNETSVDGKPHPYLGTTGFNALLFSHLADSDEVIIANLLEAVSTLEALGAGYLVSTTMISGHNTSYILDDIEEQLKLPNLNAVREKALWSIYNKFKDRAGTDEPIFIMHVGLPPAVHEYEHLENMRKVRDEFELTLNEIGLETVLIKDPEDLAHIINGMFTGEIWIGRDLTEY